MDGDPADHRLFALPLVFLKPQRFWLFVHPVGTPPFPDPGVM